MKNKDKYYFLNILRFFGAISIAVLLHYNDHLLPAIGLTNHLLEKNILIYNLSLYSYVFVEMFYLISGFLFSRVYFKKIMDKEENVSFNDFFKSRYLRIFPLIIISTIVIYFLHAKYYFTFNTFFRCGSLKIYSILFDSTFTGFSTIGFVDKTPMNGALWYIAPLMICYTLAFFLTKLYKKKNSLLIFCIPILFGIYILKSGFSFFIINISVARGLISFFIGILLGNDTILNFFKNLESKTKIFLKIIIFVLLILMLYTFNYGERELFFGDYYDIILTFACVIFPLLFILIFDIDDINKIGELKIFQFLGNISFSLYVWNFPIMIVLAYLINKHILTINPLSYRFIILNIVIHIVVASISYLFIEKNIDKLLKQSN